MWLPTMQLLVLFEDGKWIEAEVILKAMIGSGLKPSISIYNMISKAKNDV
jgi:hypothetical protein